MSMPFSMASLALSMSLADAVSSLQSSTAFVTSFARPSPASSQTEDIVRCFAGGTTWNSQKVPLAALRSTEYALSEVVTISGEVQAPSLASSKNSLPPTSEIAGVIFDMDGTLTDHCIDFADMRRRIYAIADEDLGPGNYDAGCVLALADRLSPDGRAQASDIFKEIEEKASRDMTFNDGVADLCYYIDSIDLKRAVLTRNVETSVDVMHDKLLQREGVSTFFPAIARDSTFTCNKTGRERPILAKPAPDAILHICSVWNCQPHEVIMVGDSAADDIVAASRAGCGGKVLLAEGGNIRDTDSGGGGPVDDLEVIEREPTVTVSSLMELLEMLRENM
mmetsp:Transcript_47847/g.144724  ORF Transcript_47847/g.144724 Transcript_47847/m.144724 type:complete len:336 (-) Transcript_47847:134-1141(-)|eukprot:CAMPEP_0113548112 /NCGR_PEP_ID=MMETSP0015_2-20120614/12719_1 /TAXON_ID=2838 /ORGANISM="Odontella" /LENGTH=335 /DNA_ID=CAMNT_0000448719 /DNA_START=158 /DNA_END=1165 /DNA_ORIENTATION=+ /assembly_acc=CAM_ASM_000160